MGNTRLPQYGSKASGKRRHAGLGVLGLVQYACCVSKADFFQIKIHCRRSFVKSGAERRESLVKVLAHTGVLAALPGV